MSPQKQEAKDTSDSEQSNLKVSNDIQVSFSLVDSQIGENQPVFLNFTIQNGLAETINLDLGQNSKEAFLFTIVFPDGKTTQLPQLRSQGIFRKGDLSVKPHQTYTQKLLLNQWIEFTSPGKYILEGKLASPVKNGEEVIAIDSSFSLVLDVKPRNPRHLEEISAMLAQRIMDSTNYEENSEAALAFSYVNDPVAVPFLQKVLTSNKMVEPIVIKGLERIGGKESVQVLINTINVNQY